LYCQLLNKFRIPYIAIYDKDHQAAKGDDGKTSADKSSALIEAAVEHGIGTSVVLVNDIEEEVGMIAGAKNKPFAALTHIAAPSFTISADLAAKIASMYQ
jgi:CRISPR-associated exonuclease Cas4